MKYGVREICEVVLKAKSNRKIGNKMFYKGEPVIYFDSLKTSSLEGTTSTSYVTGGRGNARLMAWEGERTVTFTMEDALISPLGLMILTGAGLVEPKQGKPLMVHTVETTDKVYKLEDGSFYIETKESCSDKGGVYVMIKSGDEIISEPYIGKSYITAAEIKTVYTGESAATLLTKDFPAEVLAHKLAGPGSNKQVTNRGSASSIYTYRYYNDTENPITLTYELSKKSIVSDEGNLVETEIVIPAKKNISINLRWDAPNNTVPGGAGATENIDSSVILAFGDMTVTHSISDPETKVEGVDRNGVRIAESETYTPDLTQLLAGSTVVVDYYTERTGGVSQIEITPDSFGGSFYLEASTLFRGTDGQDYPAEFIIPNCKVQSNFNFSMAATGDPSTFTFTMDAFPDYTYFDFTKKVICALQIIDKEYEYEHSTRAATNHDYVKPTV